jgi:hypothetical protein
LGMSRVTSRVVYLEGFLPVCKETLPVGSRAESQVVYPVVYPVACTVGWELGCLGDQVDPDHNNFQTQVQDPVLCQEFLPNRILSTQVIHRFNNLDLKACHRLWG